MRIAVIGGGIAGITAAHHLQGLHEVVLFEKNEYVGGHTHTVTIPSGPDADMPVDTGFIVLNDRTYPVLNRFLRALNVAVRKSDMSFSYYEAESGFQYASSNFNTLFPMVAAIWSAPDLAVDRFPMLTFARFFNNHGLLTVHRHPQWYTVAGGSHSYVNAFLNRFQGKVLTRTRMVSIQRKAHGVNITLDDGTSQTFDKAVIATHADEALQLLADPADDERRLLGAWRYSVNQTYLHTDPAWMPSNPNAWASWNVFRPARARADAPVTLTYYMNRIQRLESSTPYLVTLNPFKPIPDETIRRLPPTVLQRYCMKVMLSHRSGARQGWLRLWLPDGSHQDFGGGDESQPAHLKVNDYRFFSRVVLGSDIGLGESYMYAEWDTEDIAAVIAFFIRNRNRLKDGEFKESLLARLLEKFHFLSRANTLVGSRRNIRKHYDLSNAFFRTFLDETMAYSCAIFRKADESLNTAQRNKYRVIIEKARMNSSDHLLEIGCGWGGFAIEAV